ncbi:hypothetical protein PAMP_016355 [Pampus punctatissimus]
MSQSCSLFSMMWMCVAVFLLWTRSGGCTEKANTSDLIEYTAADFYDKLHSARMMFIYFEHQVSPTISLFLVELEKSAEVLQDYGISVGKINCNKELLPSYCTNERVHTAFLFRSGKEFLSFDLDTVFDVNSIVSEVLFAILRDEVKYVHSDADLLAMEKTARGKKDIVLGYVSSLGTQEHRSMMETAYVYGSKYQFILITGGPVLKHLGVDESSPSSRVWFLHCRVHTGTPVNSERCPLTHMRKPLSTLRLHSFLQLMEAPLVSEVYDDPSAVQPPQFPYQQTPQVFLFSRHATEHLDLDTATTLAWRLRGLALLLLVHRESPAVKTPDEYNAAYRLPEKGSEVKYLTLNNLDEVLELFISQEKETEGEEEEEKEEEGFEEDEEEDSHFGILDDEIAAIVYENRGNLLDMDSVTQLTSDNFHTTVAQSSLTVALFYLKWDAVSMVFLSSFIEVAERLAESEVNDVQMSTVDCGEWTDLCAAQSGSSLPIPFQPITVFPSVLLLRPQESTQYYRGMLGSEALHRFIMLCKLSDYIDKPELTVENLPSFLTLGKALLLLFVGEEEDEIGRRQNKALVEEMRAVVEMGGERMERYLACWIHLGRTPAGMSVLGSYLGSMPPLPALVLTHLPTGSEIYQYPPSSPIVAPSVLQWLQRVEDGTESFAGMLGEDSWSPAIKFYDFLKIMDKEEPGFAQQISPKQEEEEEEEEEEEIDMTGVNVEEETSDSSSNSPSSDPHPHSEL